MPAPERIYGWILKHTFFRLLVHLCMQSVKLPWRTMEETRRMKNFVLSSLRWIAAAHFLPTCSTTYVGNGTSSAFPASFLYSFIFHFHFPHFPRTATQLTLHNLQLWLHLTAITTNFNFSPTSIRFALFFHSQQQQQWFSLLKASSSSTQSFAFVSTSFFPPSLSLFASSSHQLQLEKSL